MSKRGISGSILVEASLVVPIFFIALIPFLYLLRICLSQTVLERALDEALRSLAVESYVILRDTEVSAGETVSGDTETIEGASELFSMREEMKDTAREGSNGESGDDESLVMDLAGSLYLRQKVMDILSSRDLSAMGIEGGKAGISFLASRFFYSEGTHRHLLHAEMTVRWDSPFAFVDLGQSTFSRTTHAFSGEKEEGADGNEISGKEDGDDTIVYRIGQGIHYHQADCFLIDKNIIRISVSEAELMGLLPCSRCRSDLAVTGLVCMTSGGDHYHMSSCGYLFPDLRSMTLTEALEAGLSPCGLCYGSEGYFR